MTEEGAELVRRFTNHDLRTLPEPGSPRRGVGRRQHPLDDGSDRGGLLVPEVDD